MKATSFTLLLFLSCCQWLAAQCPTGDITFSTQAQVDNFPTLNCTDISGSVEISGSDITSISGLSGIATIGGSLTLFDNDSLTSLSGLENLTAVGGNLKILGNDTLTDLQGLNGLTSVGDSLIIGNYLYLPNLYGFYGNDRLTDLAGLEGLTSIGKTLLVYRNDRLQSLTGLDNLTSVGGIEVIWNDSLTSIAALKNIVSLSGNLQITHNRLLPFLTGLDSLTSVGGILWVAQNDTLSNLAALRNVQSVGGDLYIGNLDTITTLKDLENLAYIGGGIAIFGNRALVSLSDLEIPDSINGSLHINDNNALLDLSGLENLTYVGGDLNFYYNAQLTNLSGLENLTHIGRDLNLQSTRLTTLEGLQNLTRIDSTISIQGNNDLLSMSALHNIDSVGGGIIICFNDTLSNLSGLENIKFTGDYLDLTGNKSLIDITALGQLTSVGTYLTILDNKALPNLMGLDNLLSVGTNLLVAGNNALTSISSLNQLESVGENLQVGTIANTRGGSIYGKGNSTLSTIDGFASLNHVGGGITIAGNHALTNLNGLEQFDTIPGGLTIFQNQGLVNLSGLEHVKAVEGDLSIGYNASLLSLTGLDSLEWVSGSLSLAVERQYDDDECSWATGNESLNDLTALGKLKSIGGSLRVINCESLTNLDGLEGITAVGSSLQISYNNLLSNLSGLQNLTSLGGNMLVCGNQSLTSLCMLNNDLYIGGKLWIAYNYQLSTCHAESICQYLSNPSDTVVIMSNATGCDSLAVVQAACSQSSQADHYVDDSATGAGAGTSWADAFNDLQDALAIAEEGDEIWVAEGIYKPDALGGSPSSTFLIDKNLKLYGGFVGSECILSERDIEAHPTILSGDLLGDDVEDEFMVNRSDNANHVIRVADLVNNGALLDGFVVEGGHAANPATFVITGGGIFSLGGAPTIRQCIFRQNFAVAQGGAVAFNGSPSSIFFEQCRFEKNTAGRGGAVHIVGPSSANGVSANLLNCIFEGNKAISSDGGGLRFSPGSSNSSLVMKDCRFDGNVAEYSGGGLLIDVENAEVTIDSCFFSNNRTTILDGSAMMADLNGQNTFTLTNSTFEKGTCAGSGTVVLTSVDAVGSSTVENCNFKNNLALNDAGLKVGRNSADGFFVLEVNNCSFTKNVALENGGALTFEGISSHTWLFANNCFFQENEALGNGGAILFLNDKSTAQTVASNCILDGNKSAKGGAVAALHYSQSTLPAAPGVLENCLIISNKSETASIYVDTLASLRVINCTITDNQANSVLLDSSSSFSIQNTILANPGHTEYTATPNSTFTSKGGNLVLDNSLGAWLLPSDQSGVAPDFDGDYFPLEGGNLVNAGVNAGVTALDLAGNERIQHGVVDIGAFESPYFVSSTNELAAAKLSVSPNPAGDFISIDLPSDAGQNFKVQVFDTQGRLIVLLPNSQNLDIHGLSPGMYSLRVVLGEGVLVGRFVKQ